MVYTIIGLNRLRISAVARKKIRAEADKRKVLIGCESQPSPELDELANFRHAPS